MKIIEIKSQKNGAHRNQELFGGSFGEPPEGWAVIPEDMELPDTYPFVHVEAAEGMVTAMTAGELPEPEPETEPEPTAQERLEAQVTYTAMMTDTLLEG